MDIAGIILTILGGLLLGIIITAITIIVKIWLNDKMARKEFKSQDSKKIFKVKNDKRTRKNR